MELLRSTNPETIRTREMHRVKAHRLKLRVISAYGGKCICCEETELAFLNIDHIDGGGCEHRSEVGSGTRFYYWLQRNGFPEGFQVLCANCNQAKAHQGVCPHQMELKAVG